MNSSFAPLGKPKVLDRIGDVHVLLRHSGFSQRILKQASSRSNKGNSLPIFDIAGLLGVEPHVRQQPGVQLRRRSLDDLACDGLLDRPQFGDRSVLGRRVPEQVGQCVHHRRRLREPA